MAYCGHCGFEYEPTLMQGFCTVCGSKLEVTTDAAGATMSMSRVPSLSATLAVKRGGPAGQTFDLARDRVTIGSEPTNAIPLDHSSVSPTHAIIRVSQGRFVLYDCGSAMGSLVNGEQATGESRPSARASPWVPARSCTRKAREASKSASVEPWWSPRARPRAVATRWETGTSLSEGGFALNDRSVSQRHALVQPTTQECVLYDLASNNGTFLDGVPVRGRPLYDGDILKMGDLEFQFIQDSG